MSISDASIMHHIGIVFFVLWILSTFNCCSPLAYFISLVYLYQVHHRYVVRLKKKSQFEERRQAYRRRVLSDSESVRWLNHAIERMWPICVEHIISNKVLLPIIPWFLNKYKPWTVKKTMVQHLYLGRNPPIFTEMRVLQRSTEDDHLVLEIGMNFVTADDMSAILAVQLRKRLGFGIWAKLHLTGMHLEGKVLLGVKFLREWPFLGRLRLSFSEPPYFQMTVKPLLTHGLDVTEFPGVAGWLDKLLSTAFEQTLVEPNMLVVDMKKFASSPDDQEKWFSVHEKGAVAYAKVEVIEACDMKPSDLNGLADPYVKGKLGPYTFKTKIQWKTLSPKWFEEFKIPISTWDSSNTLSMEVCDKDHFVDDTLGGCSFSITTLKDRHGKRHGMWLPLQNIKTGRLHIAITVLKPHSKEEDLSSSHYHNTEEGDGGVKAPESTDVRKMEDEMEHISIEGVEPGGVLVHHPGSHVSQIWEPRKGRSGSITRVVVEEETSARILHNTNLSECGEEYSKGGITHPLSSVRTSFKKIRSMFHGSPKAENNSTGASPSSEKVTLQVPVTEASLSAHTSEIDSPSRGRGGHRMKEKAKSILKHARNMNKSSSHGVSRSKEAHLRAECESADDESSPSFGKGKTTAVLEKGEIEIVMDANRGETVDRSEMGD